MKLNLLPKIVDTTGRAKRAFLGGSIILIASIVAAFWMANESWNRVTTAKDSVAKAQPMYQRAVDIATEADSMMAKPAVRQLVVNTSLANAMTGANRLYPDLFDFVKPYIPSFFRITSLGATPLGAQGCSVNMTGTVKNAQQYADLMLALLRIPGALTVSRAGYQGDDVIVPALTLIDQTGRPRKESKAPIPDDALDRLTYFESESSPTGFLNAGNFGTLEPGTQKDARPGESVINVTVTLPRNIQTPNPQATIKSLAGAAPAQGLPASNKGGGN